MERLLERNIASLHDRLVLLAPPETLPDGPFRNSDVDLERHGRLVRELQKLRGHIYLKEGALERHQLSPDGSHRAPEDEKSWHLLMLNPQGRVSACVWYREHHNHVYFDRLRVRNCALARTDGWRDLLWKAVELEIARARRDDLRYAEVGGWAVAEDSRRTCEGVLLALAVYSLGRISGGAIGMTTATARHRSSSMLRRIGGRRLEVDGVVVPPYYDPSYRCVMEILRFDSREPSASFGHLIERLREKLAHIPVIMRPCWPMGHTVPVLNHATPAFAS
jgi:hypothetical protein